MSNIQTLILVPDHTPQTIFRKINFKPILCYVLQATDKLSDQKPIILSSSDEMKKAVLENVTVTASPEITADTVVVLRGDLPLITEKTLTDAIAFHQKCESDMTEIGTNGVAAVLKKDTLVSLMAEGNFSLTGLLAKVHEKGGKTASFIPDSTAECAICATAKDIAQADKYIRNEINNRLMDQGVVLIDPACTYIEQGVKIGADTVIYPGAVLEGTTEIGENCVLYPNCNIKNCKIGNRVEIKSSTLMDSSVGDDTTVGPYAYVRPNSEIGTHVKIGDFVEVKKSKIGDGTKISHLTYVGDSAVGKNVNFGCGTVTVNYDGIHKFTTEIGDGAFIGCNTNLVAPVKVGENTFIAAGSTITDDIPADAFAIARARQTVKEQWVKPKDK